jgi:DNA-binding transcriptional regulator YiaG
MERRKVWTGARIRRLRKRIGDKTQSRFARRLGCSIFLLRYYEQEKMPGKRPRGVLARLLDLLEWCLDSGIELPHPDDEPAALVAAGR